MKAWIHTCPQRDDVVGPTIDSVSESDLQDVEVRRHPEGLSDLEIEDWWENELLRSSKESDFFIRLEDDILVCKNLRSRVESWAALNRTDFFLGTLFWWTGHEDHEVNFDRCDDGTIKVRSEVTLSAQAQVFKSEHVAEVLKRAKEIRKSPYYYRMGRFDFDFILHKAAAEIGLSVYQYEGSLVRHRQVQSVNCPVAGIIATEAHNFLET